MQLMPRDQALLADLALHHVMTLRQIVALSYFGSHSRASARLLKLRQAGLIRTVQSSAYLTTKEHLYAVGRGASDTLDPRVANLLAARSFTPRFIDHALATVNLRCHLIRLGLEKWWAEPQIRHTYEIRTGLLVRVEDFRPDGLALIDDAFFYIEVDRGNTSLPRFRQKVRSYRAYWERGLFAQSFPATEFGLLVVTTGERRQRHLLAALPKSLPFGVIVNIENKLRNARSFQEVRR